MNKTKKPIRFLACSAMLSAMQVEVRARDEAGFAVEGIELVRPTLDDVFADKTGHRIEGADGGTDAGAAAPPPVAAP